MKALAWSLLGLVIGVVATAAVFVSFQDWRRHEAGSQPAQQSQLDFSSRPHEAEAMSNDPLGDLDVTARVAVMRWMAANPSYEFITRDYCGCHDIEVTNCPPYDEDRARRLADYPYAEAFDYNDDGHKDFAVMLGLKGKEGPQALFIFHGPFGEDVPTPMLVGEGWKREDMISGDYVGVAESDNGYRITRKGAKYQLVYTGDPQ